MPEVSSIIQRALGKDYERLHPRIQRQYAITSGDGLMGRGTGVMTEVTRGWALMVPFLAIGARRLLLFPDTGKDVPFTVENYAYVDDLGRETITWTRTFQFEKPRRFDEYLVYSDKRKGLVVYAGSHQHLAVDLKAYVDDTGAFCIETARQVLYEFPIGIPFPGLFTGFAKVRESYDEELGRFEVDVTIDNKVFGHIFGYRGWFQHEHLPCETPPEHILPKRTEARD
jgi:hypothetical protein